MAVVNFHNLLKVVIIGIGTATYSLIANAIGENNFSRSKTLLYSSGLIWLIAFAIMHPIILFIKAFLAKIFFSEEYEIGMMEEILVLEMFYLFFQEPFCTYLYDFRAYGF